MATRLKTVEYTMPVLASMVDNTLTALTSITISLPEAPSGTVVIQPDGGSGSVGADRHPVLWCSA